MAEASTIRGYNFYCTKLKRSVEIPKKEVCGYRIRNERMKKGFSDGIKANPTTICNQRLSRFATSLDSQNASRNCSGNQNWLNPRKYFVKRKEGTRHDIRRSRFLAGTVASPSVEEVPEDITNNRVGTGNRLLRRPAFIAPTIKARDIVDFDKLILQDLSKHGLKIQLSDKTTDKLIGVSIPDPTDLQWIAEKQRLTSIGSTELPFGREQRKVRKQFNIAETGHSINDSLAIVRTAIQQSKTENTNDLANIGVLLINMLSRVGAITPNQILELSTLTRRLEIPRDLRRSGLDKRFFTQSELKQNPNIAGAVMLHLINNIPNGLSPNKPVKGLLGVPRDFRTLFDLGDEVLDVENRQILTADQALEIVTRTGADNNTLNGVNVALIAERIFRGLKPFSFRPRDIAGASSNIDESKKSLSTIAEEKKQQIFSDNEPTASEIAEAFESKLLANQSQQIEEVREAQKRRLEEFKRFPIPFSPPQTPPQTPPFLGDLTRGRRRGESLPERKRPLTEAEEQLFQLEEFSAPRERKFAEPRLPQGSSTSLESINPSPRGRLEEQTRGVVRGVDARGRIFVRGTRGQFATKPKTVEELARLRVERKEKAEKKAKKKAKKKGKK
jgi:hypothetical protein